MSSAPKPENEQQRLQSLKKLKILDTPIESRFERITRLLCRSLDMPIAAFTLVDENRQWFKSIQGMQGSETPLDVSFCAHTILGDTVMNIEDTTKDRRFSDNPLVTGDAHVRFYAGCPITAPDGQHIGALCAVDTKPRQLTAEQMETLRDFASMVETELRAQRLTQEQDDLKKDLNEAQLQAMVDPLTRLWNRRGIFELLSRRWAENTRNGGAVVVVLADIDHFKKINDTHGHHVGDAVLQTVAQKLLSAMREEDAVGRIGGEEFLIVLPGCEAAELKRTVERIREKVAASTITVPGGNIEVTLSFGAAAGMPDMFDSFEELIKFADQALYSAKNAGRNRVEVKEKAAS